MPLTKKPKPSKIIIEATDGSVKEHEMADYLDWGIQFEDVLEVRTEEETFYYPLDSVTKWSVKAHRTKIAHFSPREITSYGVERKKAEND